MQSVESLPSRKATIRDYQGAMQRITLIWNLSLSERKSQYKNMLLSGLWNFLAPVLQMFVYYVLMALIFQIREESFALFLFLSLTLHRFALSSLNRGASCFSRSQSLIMGGTLPSKTVILWMNVLETLLDMLPGLLIFLLVAIISGGAKFSLAWFSFPVLLALFVLFGYCNYQFLCCIGIYWPDLTKLISVLNGALLAFCPVLYSIERIPEKYRDIYMLNPLAGFYHSIRQVMLYGEWPSLSLLLYLIAFVVVYYFLSRAVFIRLESTVVKYW